MFHRDNPNLEAARNVNWVNENIDAGLIGAVGASNWGLDRLAAANAYAKSNCLQGVSLLSNQFGLATCRPRWPGARHLAPEE